ncbi:hypothetical protein ACLB1Q_18495 [Escherichia coli]
MKVSILAPGMGEDGERQKKPVFRRHWSLPGLCRHGIVPTRTTDFQIMFLSLMGVTRGKWVLWLTPFAPSNATMTPDTAGSGDAGLVEQYPDTYANMGIHDLGDTMFAWLKRKQPWRTVERSLFRPAGGGNHPA